MDPALRGYLEKLSEDISYIGAGLDRARLDKIYYPLIIRAESRLHNRESFLREEQRAFLRIREDIPDRVYRSLLYGWDNLEKLRASGRTVDISVTERAMIQKEWADWYQDEEFTKRFEFDRSCRGALLVGRKNSGKTVFLKRLALYYADLALGKEQRDERYEPYGLDNGMMPCIIDLREHDPCPVEELIRKSILRYVPAEAADRIIDTCSAELLLLVDGFDEVTWKKKALAGFIRYAGGRDRLSVIIACRDTAVKEIKERLDDESDLRDQYFTAFFRNAGFDVKYILDAKPYDADYTARWAGCRTDESHRGTAAERIGRFMDSEAQDDELIRMMVSVPADIDILYKKLTEGSLNIFSFLDDLIWSRLKDTVYDRREIFNDIVAFLEVYSLVSLADRDRDNSESYYLYKYRSLFDELNFCTDIADGRSAVRSDPADSSREDRQESEAAYAKPYEDLIRECCECDIADYGYGHMRLDLSWKWVMAARFLCRYMGERTPDILKAYEGELNWSEMPGLAMLYSRYNCYDLYEKLSAEFPPDRYIR